MSNQENVFKDTISVRKGEELNIPLLEFFLREHIKDLSNQALQVEQFGSGSSNLTYQLRIGEWESVLRRPPLGPVAPKAHDMNREFRILEGLHPFFPLAPKPYLYTEDTSLIGSPFFIMERRNGVILDKEFPENQIVTKETCKQISKTMINKLVELHAIDYTKTRLTSMSRPEGFMERQIKGWIGRYDRSKTEDNSKVENLKRWLTDHLPPPSSPTIIHYDYKLNNAMFSFDDLSEMVGLFDWEMTTVGEPLADLGVALAYWVQDDDPDELKFRSGKPAITIHPGFITRDEFIEEYAKKSGRDVSHINYHMVFAFFKQAVICQQIYYRWKKGQTKDERFADLKPFINCLVDCAWEKTRGTT